MFLRPVPNTHAVALSEQNSLRWQCALLWNFQCLPWLDSSDKLKALEFMARHLGMFGCFLGT